MKKTMFVFAVLSLLSTASFTTSARADDQVQPQTADMTRTPANNDQVQHETWQKPAMVDQDAQSDQTTHFHMIRMYPKI
jgi:hypothetical protein